MRTGLFILFAFFYSLLYSQPTRCITEVLLQEKLQNNPALQQRWDQQQELLRKQAARGLQARSVVTIPVVVHIVYREAEANISDQQVHSQIEVLNADFRAFNCEIAGIPGEFKNAIADTEIEFCLAQVDPVGMPTTGITRTQTNIPFFDPKGTRLFHEEDGGADAWDPAHYLNIWVANLNGTLGFASFPDLGPNPEEDGVIIDYTAFGTVGAAQKPYHLGRTTTHEIGHYFSLRHPFPGPGVPECIFDDGIEDTPMQQPNYGGRCPSYPQFSCGSSDMFMNFMNYSDDACLNMFTHGQKSWMLSALFAYRPGLLAGGICDKPPGTYTDLNLVLHPNPAVDRIRIYPPGANIPIGALRISNVSGQIIFREQYWPTIRLLDISQWTPGIYFLELYCNGKTWNGKLVKY